jgi:hypothetical protein
MAALEQDVLGLDVPVHDAPAVRVREGVGHLAADPQGVVDRKLLLAVEPVAQRLALDVGHHVVEVPRGLARIVEREDVRVGEPRGGLDLAQEALLAERGGHLGEQDLDRDRAAVAEVLGEVDRGHGAPAELRTEIVPVGEGGPQAIRDGGGVGGVGHRQVRVEVRRGSCASILRDKPRVGSKRRANGPERSRQRGSYPLQQDRPGPSARSTSQDFSG